MQQINIYDAKTDFSKLIKKLETKEEDIIYIARNGVRIAKMTLVEQSPKRPQRIGAAKGKIHVPDNFDELNEDIAKLFYGESEWKYY